MGDDPNLFNLIPVLDLLKGQVVRARGGRRQDYAPIEHANLNAKAPHQVLQFLIQKAGSSRAYLADLDKIQGGPIQEQEIRACLAVLDALWLDGGFSTIGEGLVWSRQYPGLIPVFGTETLEDTTSLKNIPAVLSLDYGAEGPRGLAHWWTQIDDWPQDVIVMSLPYVGERRGPDFEALQSIRERGFAGRLYAAGGVRDRADIEELRHLGVAGALVATSLYDGRLP